MLLNRRSDAFCAVILYIVLLSMVACSQSNENSAACPITIDAVSIVDSIEVNGTVYYLVQRISGWHDKVEILELYTIKPTFDLCSQSEIAPVYSDSIDMEEPVSQVYLNIKNKRLEVEYAPGKPGDISRLKLEVKK